MFRVCRVYLDRVGFPHEKVQDFHSVSAAQTVALARSKGPEQCFVVVRLLPTLGPTPYYGALSA